MSEQASFNDGASGSNADADMLRAMGLPSGFARASRGRGAAQAPSAPRGRGGKKEAGQPSYRGGKHSVARKQAKAQEQEKAGGGGQGFVIDSTPSWPGQGAPQFGAPARGRGGGGNDRGGRGRGRGGRGGGGGGHGGGAGQIFVQEPTPLEQIQPLFRPSFIQDPWAHLS